MNVCALRTNIYRFCEGLCPRRMTTAAAVPFHFPHSTFHIASAVAIHSTFHIPLSTLPLQLPFIPLSTFHFPHCLCSCRSFHFPHSTFHIAFYKCFSAPLTASSIFEISFEPPWAKSGLPPPEPLISAAKALAILPAFTPFSI